ncbi:MAG: hypothetical protein HY814_05355 [Candidatus Riflebacteria bacterium]|nr:hypothetical protein [Candidatus Riflebacteria bacterium]
MDVSSANRVIAISVFFGTAVVLAFAFFQVTGGFREIRLPGASLRYADDMVTPVRQPPRTVAPSIKRAPDFSNPVEPFRPSTVAEKAYFSALEKADRIDERSERLRAAHDELAAFLASDLGKEFVSAMELARSGRSDEGRPALSKLIEGMTDQSSRVQIYVLKAAIQVFQQAKDAPGLKALLQRYLTLLSDELSRVDLDARQKATASETLDQVNEAMRELEAAKP